VASGEGLALDSQGSQQGRAAAGVAHQSASLYFLLDVAGQGDVAEEASETLALDRHPTDLALELHAEAHGCWISEGACSYLLPLPRAPGV